MPTPIDFKREPRPEPKQAAEPRQDTPQKGGGSASAAPKPAPHPADEHRERIQENVKNSGTLSGAPAGDINRHAPVGPIVGEVHKSREALQPRDQLHHQLGTRQHYKAPKA